MRVADYIAEFIHEQGVRTVFMLSGTGSIHLDDAFANHPGLTHLCARHEAAAAVMAEAAAKLTGRIGAAVVTTGPGGINAIGGVSEAWVDSVPILVLSGQVEGRHYVAGNRSFGVQGFNIVEAVRTITKYAAVVDRPDSIRYHLEKAVWLATHERPGPVWLDIQLDVQSAEIDPARLPGFQPPPAQPDAAGGTSLNQDIDAILDLLRAARRPLLVLGQGVRQAGAVEDFRHLADRLGAPVQATRLALDLLPWSCPWYMGLGGIRGRPAAAAIARGADLVLSLGASLAHAFVGENFDAFAPQAKVVMVDLNEAEIAKPGATLHRAVRHDVGAVLRGLLAACDRARLPDYGGWLAECQDLKRRYPIVRPEDRGDPINSYHFIERLEAQGRPGDIVVSDAGSSYYITGQALRFEHGQRELTSGAFATMGLALPLAIGAAATCPKARVLAITGDGSIELNIQELRTISQYALPVKVFVINNGGYASIRDSQDAVCGGRYTDAQEILDFAKTAAAFELPYRLIERVADLDVALARILTEPGPALIELVCDRAQQMIRPDPAMAAAAPVTAEGD